MEGLGLLDEAWSVAKNVGMTAFNNSLAKKREKQARQENYIYNELSAQSADRRTRNLYMDLYSPQAQMEQIKEAGLSPSVYFGDVAGMSGQTGAQGAGASGISPQTFGLYDTMLTAAQTELLRAQADKTREETKTERGENDRGSAQITNIIASTAEKLANTGNLEAEKKLKEAETTAKNLQNAYTLDSYEMNLNLLYWQVGNAFLSAKKLNVDIEYLERTLDDRCKYASEQVNNLISQTLLNNSESAKNKSIIELNDKQKELIAAEIRELNTRANVELAEQHNKAKWQNFQYSIVKQQLGIKKEEVEQAWNRILQQDEALKIEWEKLSLEKKKLFLECFQKAAAGGGMLGMMSMVQ